MHYIDIYIHLHIYIYICREVVQANKVVRWGGWRRGVVSGGEALGVRARWLVPFWLLQVFTKL